MPRENGLALFERIDLGGQIIDLRTQDVEHLALHVELLFGDHIHAREAFRHHSYISPASKAVMAGFGVNGYALAIAGLAGMQ